MFRASDGKRRTPGGATRAAIVPSAGENLKIVNFGSVCDAGAATIALAMNPDWEGVMDRRQFLLAVPGGALLVTSASAQAPGRLYRIALVSPSEATVEMVRKLQLPSLPGSVSLKAAT